MNANEIKDEKSDINSDDITRSRIEKNNKSKNIHISKRKPYLTSDSEEEEIPLVATEVSSLDVVRCLACGGAGA